MFRTLEEVGGVKGANEVLSIFLPLMQKEITVLDLCAHVSFLFPDIYPFRAKKIKIKLGVLLQKPDSAVDLVIPYNEKPEKPAKTHEPLLDEALQWRLSLDKLLHSNYRLASFKGFLKSEFSEENLEFWVACEGYKKIKSPVKMAERTKQIYEEFIQTEVPKEVGTDITMKNLVEPSPSSDDLAQKRIYAPIEKDLLLCFVRSTFYKELIK
ncbi:hypothetical protein U0070_006328 [Myodes glareolus]|uniref:RGS domain-containing protein n=1 Tax=Myodes glareolus TaxID=447135 RepID=A0AAW0J2N4_MYOGA